MLTIQEAQKMTLQEQQGHVVAGLERAVQWIKEHPQSLIRLCAINPSYKLGVEVRLSSWWDRDRCDWKEFIGDLFSGKTAIKKTRYESLPRDDYTIFDKDLGILFSWTVYHETKSECTEETIEIAVKIGE